MLSGMTEPGRWWILVEENLNKNRWRVSHREAAGDDPEQAVARARQLAREFRPANPYSIRGRQAFELSEHSWLVLVRGAVTEYQFRVSLGELLASD